MNHLILGSLILLIFVAACQSAPEEQPQETNTTKESTAKKYTISETAVQETIAENQKKSCADQIEELEDDLVDTKYTLMKLNTNKTKSSYYIQYLKDEIGKEEEYEAELRNFEDIGRKIQETNEAIVDQELAIELLRETCDLGEERKTWD